MLRDKAVLLDIRRAAELALEFVAGTNLASFLTDAKTQSAVLHQLLLIGEATKRVSEELRLDHPEIPWKRMAGMRDMLIHAYDSVDLEEVWKTTCDDIPALLAALSSLARD
jgi:uncharacterized protein with HEPN domain